MYTLIRLLYRSFFAKGKPLHQIIGGIILIPIGGILAWAATFGSSHYYPYWIIAGIVLAIFGFIILIKGFIGLASSKNTFGPQPNVYSQQMYNYNQPSAQQQPYGQPAYPPVAYPPAQQPYGQPAYPPQPGQSYGQHDQSPNHYWQQ